MLQDEGRAYETHLGHLHCRVALQKRAGESGKTKLADGKGIDTATSNGNILPVCGTLKAVVLVCEKLPQ
jgi:hypothetical protein